MLNLKFTICYDGTNYFGWQRQTKEKSVQGTIEKALSKICNTEIKITGAGRTDRGVHAKGQVAMCQVPKGSDPKKLLHSLNSLLPSDITISEMSVVEDTFHPRYSAKGKIYSYSIYTEKYLDPFARHSHHHHPYTIDLELLQKAIPLFIGKKDFSSFANTLGKNSPEPSPIKEIYNIKITTTKYGFILTFHGDGFLYKMVRNLTGALLDAAGGRISLEALSEILNKRNNSHGLFQAPGVGLCLEKVLY